MALCRVVGGTGVFVILAAVEGSDGRGVDDAVRWIARFLWG